MAVRWQAITWNPVTAVDPPSIETKESIPSRPMRLATFLRLLRGHRMEARWLLAVMVGMRQGEALGLA